MMMSSGRRNDVAFVAAASFAAGVLVASLFRSRGNSKKKKINRLNAGAAAEGNDLSLFYSSDIKSLTTTSESMRFLAAELYGKLVRDCVICCVDCVIVRVSPIAHKRECLLVERATEPVKGVWWWPGGRIYKGETFFDAALRKTEEETGLTGARPIQILGFWNTFFPTSNWDTPDERGTQTVQPIVLVELTEGSEVLLDSTSERYRWISLDPDEAQKNDEDKYVVEALRRLKAWDATYRELPSSS